MTPASTDVLVPLASASGRGPGSASGRGPRTRVVHTLALITVAATYLLLLIGGLVNPTGSSLACPDWPLCYGMVNPPMEGGILYEHGHRLAATFVGFLTTVLLVLCVLARREDRRLAWLGLGAFLAVVLQGVLGGLTVIFRLPAAISIGHLALSMAFFSFVVFVAWTTRPWPTPRAAVRPGTRRLVVVAAVAVYLQIVLGAIVRHTESGLACLNDPFLCQGALWPDAPMQAQIHMLHRAGAVLTGLLCLAAAVRGARELDGRGQKLALGLGALVVAQIALGIWTVLSWRGLVEVELHLATGVLLLATAWLLVLGTRAQARAHVPGGALIPEAARP